MLNAFRRKWRNKSATNDKQQESLEASNVIKGRDAERTKPREARPSNTFAKSVSSGESSKPYKGAHYEASTTSSHELEIRCDEDSSDFGGPIVPSFSSKPRQKNQRNRNSSASGREPLMNRIDQLHRQRQRPHDGQEPSSKAEKTQRTETKAHVTPAARRRTEKNKAGDDGNERKHNSRANNALEKLESMGYQSADEMHIPFSHVTVPTKKTGSSRRRRSSINNAEIHVVPSNYASSTAGTVTTGCSSLHDSLYDGSRVGDDSCHSDGLSSCYYPMSVSSYGRSSTKGCNGSVSQRSGHTTATGRTLMSTGSALTSIFEILEYQKSRDGAPGNPAAVSAASGKRTTRRRQSIT